MLPSLDMGKIFFARKAETFEEEIGLAHGEKGKGLRVLGVGARSLLAFVLAVQVIMGALAGIAFAADDNEGLIPPPSRAQISAALSAVQGVIGKDEPVSDWAAFGLARSGLSVGKKYLPVAAKSVSDGSLRLVTDYARVALAVTASGGDASKVGADKVNLLSKIANFEKITAQGPNAPAYAILAMDAASYVPGANDRWTKDDLVKWLIDNRNADGGWSLAKGKSDVDITAIVLTALASVKDREDVKGAIEAALAWLSGVQQGTSGFGAPTEASESAVQVIIALTSLGIDPLNDARFKKNNHSIVARLLEFRTADGRFAHVPAGKADGLATLYALLGLTAVDRYMDGLPGLYAATPVASKTNITVNGNSGSIVVGSAAGKTALEALINLLKASSVSYEIKLDPQLGPYLMSIDGTTQGLFGGYDGWNFAVKRDGAWAVIMEGMATYSLQPEDELFVYYGNYGTPLIHSVTYEPKAPREGQSVTVTVEKEVFDWDAGKAVISPAADARVKVGGQTVVTDQDGKATLKSLATGSYSLTIDGYREKEAPAYLASTSKLDVASYVKKVTVRVEGDSATLAAGSAHGGTALEALEQLLKRAGIASKIPDSAYGKYISSIDGIAGGKYGGYDGWIFAVIRKGEWVIAGESIATFLLEDGDELVVYYGGNSTKLAEPLVVTPAVPKPGQDFSVRVTYRDWDWTAMKFGETAPLAGVTVTVGANSGVTDENGVAKLKGLPEGYYKLQVSGELKSDGPSVVRSATAFPISGSYRDQSAISPWAASAVKIARTVPLLRGIGDKAEDTSFQPQQAATRAEFVSALARALGLTASKSTAAFQDVPSDAWYAKDIGAAAAAGLVGGVAAGKFAPDATITREQAAILIARALKLKATQATVLADGAQVASYAVSSVQAVLQQGWMTAYAGAFSPKAAVSREQAAVIAERVWVSKQ